MSRLRARLDRLREQAGGALTTAANIEPPRPKPDLRQQLARRGRKQQRMSDEELAEYLGGRLAAPGLIVVEHRFAPGLIHGRWRIGIDRLPATLDFFGHDSDHGGLVFMDTETSGLAGGTGTIVFLLGLARFEDGGLNLKQYFLTGFSGEATLLQASLEFLEGARTLVTYNGKCFDQPLLQTRYRLASLAEPYSELAHFDLLHPTRRAFATRWPDCRLQTAEQRLLGFKRVDDLPGAEVPETWFRWVRYGVTRNLQRVVEHNEWDLVSLAALLPALAQSFEHPLSTGAEILAGARHYLSRQQEARAFAHLLAHREHLDHTTLLELAWLGKRREDWDLVLAIWQELAAQDNAEALERLAVYYEHKARDMQAALEFTRRLLCLSPGDPRHHQRKQRLLSKQTRLLAKSSRGGLQQ